MGLLNIPTGVSRVHASRRVFEHLAVSKNDLAIVHHASFPGASEVRWPHSHNIFGAQAQQMSFTSIFLWHDVDDVSVSMYERSSLKITLHASVLSDDARQVYPERRSSSGRVLGRWTWGRCDGASPGPGERHASLCLLRPATGKAKQFWRMPGEL